MFLMPHQEVARDFLLEKKRCILADEPRVGKTLPTASAAAENLPALVVCPAVARRVWDKAFMAIGVKSQILFTTQDAKEYVPADVAIVSYDSLKHIKTDGWKTLVLDESHRIKSPKAQRSIAALALMGKTEFVYCLSGTPIPNRPIEIWTVLHGLGIYKGNWLKFAFQYAKAWQSPWGLDVSGASNLPELKKKMSPWVLRRKRQDVFKGYMSPVVSMIELDLPISEREKDFDIDVLNVDPYLILALEGLSQVLKEGGIAKVPLAVDFIRGKLEESPNEPLVVMAWHKEVVSLLYQGLKDLEAEVITGETPDWKRQRNIEDFQAGNLKIIIGNIGAMSEGIDLSRSSTVIFVESTWSTAGLMQASARVENVNKKNCAATIYILTTRNSLDHRVLQGVLKKKNVIDQIL